MVAPFFFNLPPSLSPFPLVLLNSTANRGLAQKPPNRNLLRRYRNQQTPPRLPPRTPAKYKPPEGPEGARRY